MLKNMVCITCNKEFLGDPQIEFCIPNYKIDCKKKIVKPLCRNCFQKMKKEVIKNINNNFLLKNYEKYFIENYLFNPNKHKLNIKPLSLYSYPRKYFYYRDIMVHVENWIALNS